MNVVLFFVMLALGLVVWGFAFYGLMTAWEQIMPHADCLSEGFSLSECEAQP